MRRWKADGGMTDNTIENEKRINQLECREMKQSADFSARSPNSAGKSGHRFTPGDYVGHLLYVEGFRGSHQIRA